MLSQTLTSNPRRFKIKHPIVFTILLIGVTAGVQYLLWPYIRQGAFILFYPAMVIAALYGNGPLAIVLACICAKALFYEPKFSLIFEPHDAIFFGTFIVASTLVWQLGKAMKLAVERLEDAVQARDEFLSIGSHELRTPLTSLKLQNQMRARNLDRGNKDAFNEEKLRKMVRIDGLQIERLIRLVDDMLDISRIRTGRLAIEREEMDFSSMVREMIDRLHPQIEASGSTVESDCSARIEGRWDRFRLEQVVANLLTNAAKYGDGKPVKVSTRTENGNAVLSVQDHGRGIAKEHQARIFERFERAISASEVSGLGLGLYIAREILKMHGGTITVDSVPGNGSTFTVTLPLR